MFNVLRPGMSDLEFRMINNGLHVHVPGNKGIAMVTTVKKNKEGFTQKQVKRAQEAKELYAKLAYPSLVDFKWAVLSNQIANCPVTVEDIDVAQIIWGKDIAALKGKTTRKKPMPLEGNALRVPRAILKLHKYVVLAMDIFFVCGVPFFLTLSRKLDFAAATHLVNRKLETIYAAFKENCAFYAKRGFKVTTVHADGEFEPVKKLADADKDCPTINLTSKGEHVGEIERRIRMLKERIRAIRAGLPIRRLPLLMMINMVLYAVHNLLPYQRWN